MSGRPNTKAAAYRAAYPAPDDRAAWLVCPLPFRTVPYKGIPGPHEREYSAIPAKLPPLPQGGQGPEGSPTVTVGKRESAAKAGVDAWNAYGNAEAVRRAIAPFKGKSAPDVPAKVAQGYVPRTKWGA